jgi:hypothetical protein
MKIKVDLTESGCQKPGCKHKFSKPNRHHLRHEKRWLNLWSYCAPPRWVWKGETKGPNTYLVRLKERYFQFRAQDTCRICEWHHAEIHEVYATIYRHAESEFNLPWKAFDWRQAIYVMRECKKYCREWLSRPSPGLSPRAAGWKSGLGDFPSSLDKSR